MRRFQLAVLTAVLLLGCGVSFEDLYRLRDMGSCSELIRLHGRAAFAAGGSTDAQVKSEKLVYDCYARHGNWEGLASLDPFEYPTMRDGGPIELDDSTCIEYIYARIALGRDSPMILLNPVPPSGARIDDPAWDPLSPVCRGMAIDVSIFTLKDWPADRKAAVAGTNGAWMRPMLKRCLYSVYTSGIALAEQEKVVGYVKQCMNEAEIPDEAIRKKVQGEIDKRGAAAKQTDEQQREAQQALVARKAAIGQGEIAANRCNEDRHAGLQRILGTLKTAMESAKCIYREHHIMVATPEGAAVELSLWGSGDYELLAAGYSHIDLKVLDAERYPVVTTTDYADFYISWAGGLYTDNRLIQSGTMGAYEVTVSGMGCALIILCKRY